MGNGRDHGAGHNHGHDLGDGHQDEGRGHHDHQHDDHHSGGEGGGEGASEGHHQSVSSPLLNSSTTLLGQTRRNCNALPVGVDFLLFDKKKHLHAIAPTLKLLSCFRYLYSVAFLG